MKQFQRNLGIFVATCFILSGIGAMLMGEICTGKSNYRECYTPDNPIVFYIHCFFPIAIGSFAIYMIYKSKS